MSRVNVIAEAGVNHNGSVDAALRLVDVAADAGADAVKFQTFRASGMVTGSAPKCGYQERAGEAGESQLAVLEPLELDLEAHRRLAGHCADRGVEFMSTPFDRDSLRMLVSDVGVRRLKVSSGDLTDAPLLLDAAASALPVILATGMSTLGDIERALGALAFGYAGAGGQPSPAHFADAYASEKGRARLREKVVLLHCTSRYPAPPEEANLRAMLTVREAFGLEVGYSDHTTGTGVSVAAAALGAVVIEKHFTLERALPGPDHAASLEPRELARMVQEIRTVESAMGSAAKVPTAGELANRDVVRKSLVAARPIPAGKVIEPDDVAVKRPGTGVSPMRMWDILGRPAPRSYDVDEMLEI